MAQVFLTSNKWQRENLTFKTPCCDGHQLQAGQLWESSSQNETLVPGIPGFQDLIQTPTSLSSFHNAMISWIKKISLTVKKYAKNADQLFSISI